MSDKTLRMRKAKKGETFREWLNRQREIDEIQKAENTIVDTGEDLLELGDYPFQIRPWGAKWYNLIGDIDFWAESEYWPSVNYTAISLQHGHIAVERQDRTDESR